MSTGYIAVIDIGKTNKKVLIFDDRLRIVESAYESFEEYVEGDIHFENIGPMTAWIKKQLGIFARTYSIRALSISAHGATVVCIDKNGNLAVPPVAYTTETDETFRREFYETFGSPAELQQKTATAEVGSLINSGKKIYFLRKTYPEKFRNVHTILQYPQYFGYVFTGKTGAEPTYPGCHSYLLDFEKKSWSCVAEKMGILSLLPGTIQNSWEILGTVAPSVARETGLSTECIVTMGIHDSNSSLLPYLVKGYKNFVLNSTGTWCVAMHPTGSVRFTQQELGKLVFYNMDAFFNPVKTSIFMGGLEFGKYTGLLKEINNRDDYPTFSHERYQRIISGSDQFILPSVVKGTGLFPDSLPRVIDRGVVYPLADIESGRAVPALFGEYENAWAVLTISLALQTATALGMAGYEGNGSIFTEGGFRKNIGYNSVLAALHPTSRYALTNLEEATAFGAAMLGKAALDNSTPWDLAGYYDIETVPLDIPVYPGLDAYKARFESLV